MTHPGWGEKWMGAQALPTPRAPARTASPVPGRSGTAPTGPRFWTRRRRRALRVVLLCAVTVLLAVAFLLAWVALDAA
ncbi:hypothetical protein, partial [Promicromonospora kroppenstedtii]|uniref:hypothetical protein n=1 Tax=Promicromonospora kroppenstedtii TaxID=440482 RepID=UPI001B7FC746